MKAIDFQTRMLEEIGAIRGDMLVMRGEVNGVKVEVAGVNKRLDILNGSVARHEQAINDLKIDKRVADAVKETHEQDEKDTRDKMQRYVWPILRIVAIVLGSYLAGQHGRELVHLVWP